MAFCPFWDVSELLAAPRKKHPARLFVPQGGSDPKHFLGGRRPKKWGRSRPIWCFFRGGFSLGVFADFP